jgi:glycosyltransferase involved in cell wall biosynthesis
VIDKDLSMKEMIRLYKSCHVSLLPSKWEGIGIPFIESLALGLPVITVDAPPMNEWVKNGRNGFTAKVARWESRRDEELLVRAAIVDDDDYSRRIELIANRAMLKKMSANAVKSVANSSKVFTREIVSFTRALCAK